MSLSMYEASIPVFVRGLDNLAAILAKAAAHAEAKKIDGSVLVTARLFPDMFPLARQVQIACDTAKGCAARLAGVDAPKHEDTETTFAELAARIHKAREFVSSITAAQVDQSRDKTITLPTPPPYPPMVFTGINYLTYFVLPNFYFHITTAYNILRHNGVEIGKFEYLGKPPTA